MITNRLIPLKSNDQNEFDADYIRDAAEIYSSSPTPALRSQLTSWLGLLNEQSLGYFRVKFTNQAADPFELNTDYLVELYKEGEFEAHAFFISSGRLIAMAFNEYWGNPVRFAAMSDVPTAVSQLTNDAGYITSAEIESGVTSFNGRYGAVQPQAGDYTPVMVGINTSGILKESGGVVSAAVAGTDYQAPMTAGTDYQVPMKVELSPSTGAGTNKYSMFFKMYKNTSTTNCTATFLITGTNDFSDPNSDLYLLVCRARSSGFSGTVTKLHGSDGVDPEFGYYLSDNEWYVGITRENYSRHTAVILLQAEGSQVNYAALKEWLTSSSAPSGWTAFSTVEDYTADASPSQAIQPYQGSITYKTFFRVPKLTSGTSHYQILYAGAGALTGGAWNGVYILSFRLAGNSSGGAITPGVKVLIHSATSSSGVQFGYYSDENYWYFGVLTPKYSGHGRAILLEGASASSNYIKNWSIATAQPSGWTGIDNSELVVFDTVPTAASGNGVTSGGVYTAFADKLGRTDNLTDGNTSTDPMARAISIGTADLVAGSSNLDSGTIYLKYEA